MGAVAVMCIHMVGHVGGSRHENVCIHMVGHMGGSHHENKNTTHVFMFVVIWVLFSYILVIYRL